MNYKDATTILGLPDKWTDDMLRKAYRQKALRYHPDKNSSNDASFQFDLVKRAFEYLVNCKTMDCNKTENDNDNEKQSIIEELFDKLRPFDHEKLQKLFGACKDVVGITKEMVGEIMTKTNRKETKYEIEVELSRMLKDEVYMLNHKGIPLVVPLWFDDVYYDKLNSDDENVSISVIPILPKEINVTIKESNHIVVKIPIECLSTFDVKPFQSPNADVIDLDVSKLRKGSKITLWNVGLLKVFETTAEKMNTTEREGVTFIVV